MVNLSIGFAGNGPQYHNRALTDTIAMVAADRYEVAFYYADDPDNTGEPGINAQVYRSSWTNTQQGNLWVQTSPDGINYAANGNGAILFAGFSDGTLLAIGELSGVNGAAGATTITDDSRTVTFALTPLNNDIYGLEAAGSPDPTGATFKLTAHDGPADWDIHLNGGGGSFTVFKRIPINGFAYPFFNLPQNAVFQASYWIDFGGVTSGIVTAGHPEVFTAFIGEVTDYHAAMTSGISVLGTFNISTGTPNVVYSPDALSPLPMLEPFLLELTTFIHSGLITIRIEIPVHAWNNDPGWNQQAGLQNIQPGKWYVRGGIANTTLDMGIDQHSTGGSILLGIGDYIVDPVTVTFNTDGGVPVPNPQKVPRHSIAFKPVAMTKAGYTFDAWYDDTSFTNKWEFAADTVADDCTLYAHWIMDIPLTSISTIAAYLDCAAETGTAIDPIYLPMQIHLGTMPLPGSAWRQLLDAIETAGKYVAVDLSACSMSGTVFDPAPGVTAGKNKIVSIVLPAGAANIVSGDMEDPAFKNFGKLQTVTGENVHYIGSHAFSGCTTLTDAHFPAATHIGSSAFYDCIGLESVHFPAVTTIGSQAFRGCTSLAAADIPAAISVGNEAFFDCIALEHIAFPIATSIGSRAFSGCTALTNASFPIATSIGSQAFAACAALTALDFPAATSIGDGAFFDCIALEDISFPAVTSIGSQAFRGCTALTALDFPIAASIGDEAFAFCIALEDVSFPAVTSIGSQAFRGCTALTGLDFPIAVSIGDGAFYDCTALESAVFLTVTAIGSQAFRGCTALIGVTIPAITSIPSQAFYDCASMESADFPLVTSIGPQAFYACFALAAVDIPAAIAIEFQAFAGGSSLTELDFPAVTDIGADAFFYCITLENAHFPAVTSIGSTAFRVCVSLTTITLGDTAPTVGINMFQSITAAQTITVQVPAGATGYGILPETYSGDDSTENWGNALRGLGWNGDDYLTGTPNDHITLIITD